jgi:glutamyl-tRNA synthetase
MTVITRFAPSPTGALHIGSARTALFNYLFAKRHGGKFLLRIEDTDKQRSTTQATTSLLSALQWLGLTSQDSVVYQSAREQRHKDIAQQLLESNKAYKCFMDPQQVQKEKEQAMTLGKSFFFNSPWRDLDASSHPQDQPYVIRFKAQRDGITIVNDLIHGPVNFENSGIEDMVLLRSDQTPLYNLCVCVDDHDMAITHIIRGEDHLTNAAKQVMLYQALGWPVPQMSHIPLIHGADGAKLSKRHGATNVEEYKDQGYLPSALLSYILRLGWSGDLAEIADLQEASKVFEIKGIGKSCSRIDFDKMQNINFQYIKNSTDQELAQQVTTQLNKENIDLTPTQKLHICQSMKNLKLRAATILQLAQQAKIYLDLPIVYSQEAQEILAKTEQSLVDQTIAMLQNMESNEEEDLKNAFFKLSEQLGLKLGVLMQPIRCLITGATASASVFEIISIIGKSLALTRMKHFRNL